MLAGGRREVLVSGEKFTRYLDMYHALLQARWRVIFSWAFLAYVGIGAAFAVLFLLDPGGVAGAKLGDFGDHFAFSIQTLSTIGYGGMSPATTYTEALVVLESFIGLVGVALITGLMFAKLSRPSSRVAFSNVAVVAPRNGVPTLQLRMANERRSRIVSAKVTVSALMSETTAEGQTLVRFFPLHLERESTPMFSLSWLLLHPLDEHSPLHGFTREDFDTRLSLVLVQVTGIEEGFMQTVHVDKTYLPEDIRLNHVFEDMLETPDEDTLLMHLERIHNTAPYAPQES